MKHHVRAGIAGLLIAAAAAPVAHAADVTFRAEGGTQTIVGQVTVPETGPDVTKQGKVCAGGSAGGALDRATLGDWDGTAFSFGLSVDRIRTENLPFSSGKYWQFDVNNSGAPVGACDYDLQPGDEILFYTACATATEGCFTGKPLGITAPATVTAGVPFTVTVLEFDDTRSPATSAPAANATVTGGGVTATTGAAGTTQLTLPAPGPVTLVTTKGMQVRDSAPVTVQAAPVYSVPTPDATPGDTTAPVSRVRGIRNGRVFRRRGPRELRAVIEEAGGLASVQIALTRRVGRRCSAFDGASERFVAVRCGRHPRLEVGTARELSFLLPDRLRAGKYVFDVAARDTAGNQEALERSRNRIAFRVR